MRTSPDPDPSAARLDRWLWAVRIFKTRTSATAACRAGSVTIGGVPVKPARDVRPGERVVVRLGLIERSLVVLGLPAARVGARWVPSFCDDQTPPEAYERAQADRIGQFLAREKGSGRPTKQDRRALDRVFRPDRSTG